MLPPAPQHVPRQQQPEQQQQPQQQAQVTGAPGWQQHDVVGPPNGHVPQQHQGAQPRDSPLASRVLQHPQDPNALELASPTPPARFGGLPSAKRPRTTATPVRLFR